MTVLDPSVSFPATKANRAPKTHKYLFKRLFQNGRLFNKVFVERLTEPLHLNIISLFVAAFGSYRAKVAFDLIVRQQYAFPILFAADEAKRHGYKKVTIVELGVASGAGLLTMCRIAEATTKATGIEFRIVGFDGGKGMPPAIDYRDHPEMFQEGDYPMADFAGLKRVLPANAELIIGDVAETAPAFAKTLTADAPLGFVAVDVDYYSAAKASLPILDGAASSYLPVVPIYLDDIAEFGANPWTGEELAVNEFNAEHDLRKIAPFNFLRERRIFKNPQWIGQMFSAHIHDHPRRSTANRRAKTLKLGNEYL
jgi:hypothetical protein